MSKKSRKRVTAAAIAAMGSGLLFSPLTAMAAPASFGWVKTGSAWYYYNSKGIKAANCWAQDSSKRWFYLGSDGAMVTNGWAQDSSKKWFYLGSDGAMVTNSWAQDSSKCWFYLGNDGAMVTNTWAQDSSKKWFYLGSNGAMVTNSWVQYNGKSYYLNAGGDLAVNTTTPDGSLVDITGAKVLSNIGGNTGTVIGDDTSLDGGGGGGGSANYNQVAPTGLVGVAPTSVDSSDGKITGTTTAMEYKLASAKTYIAVTGTEIDNLPAGTYEVRYKAKTVYSEDKYGVSKTVYNAGATTAITLTTSLFDDRYQVSTIINKMAVGATEYSIVSTDENDFPNTSYFCAANLGGNSNIKIMSCYGAYDANEWAMMTLSQQAAAAQSYFDNTAGYENYKVVGILNGDTYNMSNGEPTGALVMGGIKYHDAGGRPFFGILKDGSAVIRDSSGSLADCESAVGGFEIIVKDGENLMDPNSKDAYKGIMYSRAAIGIREDGTVVTMATHGTCRPESYGLTYYEVAAYMKAMGCADVLMLDGGGSVEWCSKYEGSDELIVRNSPSDGCERSVSSSIIIVSTAPEDGVFDHASITPATTVYTPNSTVIFKATGVDSAGGAANIPEGTTWKLFDSSYGTIDGDGRFISNGKTGDVTVQLINNDNIVGSSTISIEAPDLITFASPEISVGRGQESDLGILVRYKGRTVNYNANDFIWSLSNNDMGMVNTDTNTFTASPDLTTTGIITITSKYDDYVYGSITVNVGQDPTVAMDFEDHTTAEGTVTGAYEYWGADSNGKIVGRANFAASGGSITYLTPATGMITTGCYNRGGAESAEVVSRADGYPVHLGTNSLKINYDMSAVTGTEGANVGLTEDYLIPGNPTAIGLWVYIPENTPNLWLRVRLAMYDSNGAYIGTTQFNFTDDCKTAFANRGTYGGLSDVEAGTWKFLSADLSAYAGSTFKMLAGETIRIMWVSNSVALPSSPYNSRTDVTNSNGIYLSDGTTISKSACVGSIYVDDLMFIYGSINEDAKAPSVTSFTANDEALSDSMKFDTSTINFKAIFNDEYDTDNKVKASGIDFDNVYMYVDGQLMNNSVVDKGGMIQLDGVILANGEHSVKLLVCDTNGNEKILNYRFIVDVPSSTATTVQLVSRQMEASLGGSVDLDVQASEVSNVNAMTMTLQIDSKYQDRYRITAGDGYSIDEGSIAYNKVDHTVTFTANRVADATSNGGGTIATISFSIPRTLAEGTYFDYNVASGSITYASSYTEANQPSFSSLNYRLPVALPNISISSDVIVAGMNNCSFYVKDTNGNPMIGATIYFSDDSVIGTTDIYGKVEVPDSITSAATPFTIYAKDIDGNVSFNYNGQSFAPGGAAADGSPIYILNNVSSDGSTIKKLSWLSNPLYSLDEAYVQISDLKENIEGGNIFSGSSVLIPFKGSANANENYAARINNVTLERLTPDQTYFYRVGDGFTWSAVDSFKMAQEDGDTNLFILGDIQAEDNTNIQTILQNLDSDGIKYDLGIQTGDAVELASLYSNWTDALGVMGSLTKSQDMLHVIGNHELSGESGKNIASAIYGLENGSYYSARYGSVYVATIGYSDNMNDYEAALEWLVNDASASNAAYKILTIHQPAYYTNNTDPSNEALHELLPAYAEKAGIDVVFSGHDHSYARTENINGVTYYICGTSGEKAYPVTDNPEFHFAIATDDFTATYLTVKATSEGLTVDTYDLVDGVPTIIDTYTKTNEISAETDVDKLAADKIIIENGTYEIPIEDQIDQPTKTAWVQNAVDTLIANGTNATITWNAETSSYDVELSLNTVNDTATIIVTEAADLSNDATLTAVAGQEIIAGVEAGTAESPKTASINVTNEVATIAAGDVDAKDAGATVTFYGLDNTFTNPEISTIDLTEGGANVAYIKIVAEDSTALYYAITINRALPLNNNAI